MGTCPYCGTPYPDGATYCGSCGQPVTDVAAQTSAKPDRTMRWVLFAAVGGGCLLLLIAIIGIVAALFIPNFIDALQKAKQKRTIADVRSIATALESARGDEKHYPIVGDAAAPGTAPPPRRSRRHAPDAGQRP